MVPERDERCRVTEPRRLVRRQRLDDELEVDLPGRPTDRAHVRVDPGNPGLARERRQTALDQVLLARSQLDGAPATDQVRDEVE